MGTDSLGPDHPVDGQIRFNKSSDDAEVYIYDRWLKLVTQTGSIKASSKDTFVGDGVNRVFSPMRHAYDLGQEILILVFIGNVFQNPGVAYIVQGDQIEFANPPPLGQQVIILHGFSR